MVSAVYGLALKRFMRSPARVNDWRLVALMNAVFWALAALIGTLLWVSYKELNWPSAPTWIVIGLAGFAVGFVSRAVRPKTPAPSDEILKDNLEWADTGFSAILLAAFIMYFFLQAFRIPSGSMRLTLLEGDHLFVNKFVYGLRVPYTGKRLVRWKPVRRGDVVVFRFPTDDKASPHHGKDFIKRAVALPGDTVEIKERKLFVNGEAQTEPYIHFEDEFTYPPPSGILTSSDSIQDLWQTRRLGMAVQERARDNFGPITVPAGTYFCMGDNRDKSYDSRFWGPMPDTHLKGRAWFVYWPLSRRKIIR